jgi:hypothetical protein
MFPSSFNLQGGTGISLAPKNPQPVSKAQVQGPSPASYLEPYRAAPATPAYRAPATSGGGASTYSAPAPPPDPYARWGGIAQYKAYQNSLATGKSNALTAGNEAFDALKTSLYGSADDLIDSQTIGQHSIDHARENVELNRLRSVSDLLDYVRGGIKQGSSRLASMNALDSSGSDAISRAYAKIGNKQSRDIGNQAFLGNRDIDPQQESLDIARSSGQKKLQRFKESETQRIGSEVRQKLAALNEQAVGLSLPDRISVDQEKQSLIDAGMRKLAEVDSYVGSKLGGLKPEATDQVQLTARNLQNAGAPSVNPFSMDLPIQTGSGTLQGPAIDQLPIFLPSKRKQ